MALISELFNIYRCNCCSESTGNLSHTRYDPMAQWVMEPIPLARWTRVPTTPAGVNNDIKF